MVNEKTGLRELAYVVKILDVFPIEGSDNCEGVLVNGWRVMVPKGQFHVGDLAVYFEIDSKVDCTQAGLGFLSKRNGKIKTQRFTFGGKGNFISQGLVLSFSNLGIAPRSEGEFLTKELGVTYIEAEDNERKAPISAEDRFKSKYKRFAKTKIGKFVMRHKALRDIFLWFVKKKKDQKAFPTGQFPGVSITDQERCENMPWVLEDKTPFIVTQKCDGSSATYILERVRKNKYEFYVCSRKVRMLDRNQECFHGQNVYWEMADKYNIYDTMKKYLEDNKDISFVCWQGEICAPNIQKNPHNLKNAHLYCFHWTDSKHGRMDIREANELWREMNMEVVPIVCDEYIMPNDFEEFKKSADGYYHPNVCEGNPTCPREGYVYYKTTDPTFSFKNVSREYLLNR